MAIFYRAAITAENYESFRRVLKDAPATFDEFSRKRAEGLSNIGDGRVVYIKIDPNEFAADCLATNTTNDLKSLDYFAFKKAPRDKE